MARGVSATALAPVISAVIQLGTVPLLLRAWGAAKYGDWLLLSAIPSYLSLSDLGFGDASATDMTLRVSSGDRDGALRTFQSSWVLLTAVSLLILLLAVPLTWFVPWQPWLHLSSLSSKNAELIILVLALYTVITQQMGILQSGFWCEGNYATGLFWSNILRLTEVTLATIVGLRTGDLLTVSFTYLATRIVGTIGYRYVLRVRSPWIRFGVRHAEWKIVKSLVAPAFGFLGIPAGQAITGQGFTLIIGATLGPLAVTAFSTLRTLTRVNFQAINMIAIPIWPEFSAAFGRGDIPLARILHRRAYQFALGFSLLGASLLWFFGPWAYHLWTRNSLPLEMSCFRVLIAVTLLNSLWYTSSIVAMSTNAHSRIAAVFVLGCFVSLGLAWFLTPIFGVTGAAISLLLIDVLMAWIVMRTALTQVQDTLPDLLAATIGIKYPSRSAIPQLEKEQPELTAAGIEIE